MLDPACNWERGGRFRHAPPAPELKRKEGSEEGQVEEKTAKLKPERGNRERERKREMRAECNATHKKRVEMEGGVTEIPWPISCSNRMLPRRRETGFHRQTCNFTLCGRGDVCPSSAAASDVWWRRQKCAFLPVKFKFRKERKVLFCHSSWIIARRQIQMAPSSC